MDLTFLSSGNALKNFRKEHYDNQEGICPILKQHVPFEDTVVDHQHKTKAEELGKNGAGLVRGVIHNAANAAEGTITSIYKRRGLHKLISLPDYLRNLADYLENPPLITFGFVHPNEKPKAKMLGKREFNRVIKYWLQMYPKRKQPAFPKSGKMTKDFEKWVKEANEIHWKN